MIIIEGMDNTGKTNLGDYLAMGLGGRLIHSGGPVTRETTGQRLMWCEVHLKYPHLLVFDRFPLISEYIYGPILRGSCPWDDFCDRSILMEWLKSFRPYIILCRPPLENIRNNFESRNQMSGVKDKLRELVEAYDAFFDLLRHNGFDISIYDYTKDPDAKRYTGTLALNHKIKEFPVNY